MRSHQLCLAFICLLACLLVSACRAGPKQDSVPYQVAINWYMPLKMRVDKTWDMVRTHVSGVAPQVTHLIEVTILETPNQQPGMPQVISGQTLVLPFDSYAQDTEPPARMTEHITSPAGWVRPTARATGSSPKPWR